MFETTWNTGKSPDQQTFVSNNETIFHWLVDKVRYTIIKAIVTSSPVVATYSTSDAIGWLGGTANIDSRTASIFLKNDKIDGLELVEIYR